MDLAARYSHRLVLFFVAGLGAWMVLGGEVQGIDLAFAGLCILANEIRLMLKLDRWSKLVFTIWLVVFLQLPTVYFIARLFPNFLSQLPTAPLPVEMVLPVAIVAMALPFQVFAAYYASMPRAHHLIMIFALVECVLAAKAAKPDALWLWMLILVVAMALAMIFGSAQDLTNEAQKTKYKDKHNKKPPRPELGGKAVLHRGMLPWIAVLLPSLLFLAAVLFALIPMPSKVAAPSAKAKPVDTRQAASLRDRQGFPRLETGETWREPKDVDKRVSGLQQNVQLGKFGALLLDNRPYASALIRAQKQALPADVREHAYFRIDTLDAFDGQTWRSSRSDAPVVVRDLASAKSMTDNVEVFHDFKAEDWAERFVFADVEIDYQDTLIATESGLALAYPGALVRMRTINREPSSGKKLEFLGEAEQAKLLPDISGRAVIRSVEMQCFLPRTPIRDAKVSAGEFQKYARSSYRDLPEHYREILKEWPEIERFERFSHDPLVLADVLEAWFRQDGGFGYSLEERPTGADALPNFIMQKSQRIGHCEYFASAMVVLLRYFGVDSRLAVGFAPQQSTQLSDAEVLYQLRYSDAHAWVEVRVPGHGWATFDPTTAVLADLKTKQTLANFDAGLDHSSASALERAAAEAKQHPSKLPSAPQDAMKLALNFVGDAFSGASTIGTLVLRVVAGLLVFVILFWLYRWTRQRRARALGRQDSVFTQEQVAELSAHLGARDASLFQRFLAACERFDVRRIRSQTPREFVMAMGQVVEVDVSFLRETVQAFYEICYAAPSENRAKELHLEISRDIERLERLATA